MGLLLLCWGSPGLSSTELVWVWIRLELGRFCVLMAVPAGSPLLSQLLLPWHIRGGHILHLEADLGALYLFCCSGYGWKEAQPFGAASKLVQNQAVAISPKFLFELKRSGRGLTSLL